MSLSTVADRTRNRRSRGVTDDPWGKYPLENHLFLRSSRGNYPTSGTKGNVHSKRSIRSSSTKNEFRVCLYRYRTFNVYINQNSIATKSLGRHWVFLNSINFSCISNKTVPWTIRFLDNRDPALKTYRFSSLMRSHSFFLPNLMTVFSLCSYLNFSDC